MATKLIQSKPTVVHYGAVSGAGGAPSASSMAPGAGIMGGGGRSGGMLSGGTINYSDVEKLFGMVRAFKSIQAPPIQVDSVPTLPVETAGACLYRCGLYRFKCP